MRVSFRVAGRHAALVVIGGLFLAPAAAMVLAGLMSDHQVFTTALWPRPFHWSNLGRALDRQPLLRQAMTTLVVAGLGTIGVLVSSIPAAYALANLRWRGRRWALAVVVAPFLLPVQVTAIPLYAAYARLGWVGSLLPLVVPSFFGDAFAIFLLRQFFVTVPEPMLDACRLEGGGEWTVLRRVVLPMTRPGVAAVALLTAVFAWNDFFNPLLYVGQRPQNWTLSVALAQYRGVHHVEWNLTMAAATLVALPLVVVFLVAQRSLTDGVAAQAQP